MEYINGVVTATIDTARGTFRPVRIEFSAHLFHHQCRLVSFDRSVELEELTIVFVPPWHDATAVEEESAQEADDEGGATEDCGENGQTLGGYLPASGGGRGFGPHARRQRHPLLLQHHAASSLARCRAELLIVIS